MDDSSVWLRELITPWDIYLHGARDVLAWQRTPFQEVCIVSTEAFGKKLFLDGIVQSSEVDEFLYHESLVQVAMHAVGDARRVLILGGGEGACLREALRWSCVERAVMVDLDADVVELCRKLLPEWHRGSFDDPRTTLLHTDAVAYLEASVAEPFDVIVSDMTDPVADGPSTFCFTEQYFERASRALTERGVIAVQAGPQSPAEIGLHAKVVRTMERVFPYVHAYPCVAAVYGRPLGFVVASNSPIEPRLAPERTAPLAAQHLQGETRYVTPAVAHGLAAELPFVRAAIVRDPDDVYTDAAPPQTAHAAGWEA